MTPWFQSPPKQLRVQNTDDMQKLETALQKKHTSFELSSLKAKLFDIVEISNVRKLGGDIGRLSKLNNLESLYLSHNRFVGSLNAILVLEQLVIVELAHNYLSGPIPDSICSLTKLKRLDLGSNLLSGEIPPSLGKLQGLKSLNLGINRLEGEIPADLCKLTGLIELNLAHNLLSGKIPDMIGEMKNLDAM